MASIFQSGAHVKLDHAFDLHLTSGIGLSSFTYSLRDFNDCSPRIENSRPRPTLTLPLNTAIDINTMNYVPTIGTDTSTLEHQGQRPQQIMLAEQQAKKRAKTKAMRAKCRQEQNAYVQEVLQEKRLEDMLSSMRGLELVGGETSKYAEDNAEITSHSGQTEQKEAETRAEHRLVLQARCDSKIKKRNEARGSSQQVIWREHREASKEQKKREKERGDQQSGLETLSSDAQRQGEMIPPSGRQSWREARQQARLIVSQGAKYVPTVPSAPQLHREPAFHLDHNTLPNMPMLSHTCHGSDGQAQVEMALRYGQGASAMPPRPRIQDQIGSPMEVDV
ncbi:hypothetical protein P171DRAFT_488861 [Karstenula rhodostoma CBS 690.94]|uniref:Uncharacterized protein n=1 Tax=Karstenula rhodostoma CBS 690.94 TaxID=1392251 RepID=A0A9P4PA96_9PLEO|nr:hypothetical protein P171DRAFT_488861 [Karstenula rhodostoma CBS 690.94]